MLRLGGMLSSNPDGMYSSLYLRLLGLQGGSHSWMQQDCLSADRSSACLGSPVPDINLACVDQVEHFVIKPRFALKKLSFMELLLISSCLSGCRFLPLLANEHGCG